MFYFSPQYARKNNWKIISNRLQVHTIISNFIHPSQLKDTKQYLTTDTGIFLNYLIQIEWVKGLHASILAFNIVQFFSFMNHWPLSIILTKVGFDLNIFQFFSSYLIHRQTQYVWNSFTSSFFKTDVGAGWRFALSFIFSVLYYSYFLYIGKKEQKIFWSLFQFLFCYLCYDAYED